VLNLGKSRPMPRKTWLGDPGGPLAVWVCTVLRPNMVPWKIRICPTRNSVSQNCGERFLLYHALASKEGHLHVRKRV
jgi:hypothetical protein